MCVQTVRPIEYSAPVLPAIIAGLRFLTRPGIEDRVLPGVLLTLIFALIALRLHSVTPGGALTGSAVSLAIYIGCGPAGFVALATVFALTAIATRLGISRKQKLGAAESRQGRRAGQVLANLSVAATLGVLGGVFGLASWMLTSMVAALAEATADTVASECGQAWSDRVYMITTFRRVPVGTDGGISVPGTLAGSCASAIIAILSYRMDLVAYHASILAGTAGVLGMFADSVLGATFERRRWFGNNTVNFLSTLLAAALALLFML